MEASLTVISPFTGMLTTQTRSGQSLERFPTTDNHQAICVKSAIIDCIAGVKITLARKDEGVIPLSTAEEAFPRRNR